MTFSKRTQSSAMAALHVGFLHLLKYLKVGTDFFEGRSEFKS